MGCMTVFGDNYACVEQYSVPAISALVIWCVMLWSLCCFTNKKVKDKQEQNKESVPCMSAVRTSVIREPMWSREAFVPNLGSSNEVHPQDSVYNATIKLKKSVALSQRYDDPECKNKAIFNIDNHIFGLPQQYNHPTYKNKVIDIEDTSIEDSTEDPIEVAEYNNPENLLPKYEDPPSYKEIDRELNN